MRKNNSLLTTFDKVVLTLIALVLFSSTFFLLYKVTILYGDLRVLNHQLNSQSEVE